MTPKEKAEELFNKMLNTDVMDMTRFCAKQCALIAVQEIIKAMRKGIPEIDYGTGYWSAVKQEIEKL